MTNSASSNVDVASAKSRRRSIGRPDVRALFQYAGAGGRRGCARGAPERTLSSKPPWHALGAAPVDSSEMVPERAEEDGVRVLTLKNPPVNALSTRLLQRLGERIGAIERDASVRAVVLQGDGQYFSAGADLKEMASMDLA